MYKFHCWIVIQHQTLDMEEENEIITPSERDIKMTRVIDELKARLQKEYGLNHPIFERKQKRIDRLNRIFPFLKIPSVNSQHDNYKLYGNGLGTYTHLHFTGHRNHKSGYQTEEEMLEWIRVNLPYSYGLLYMHDDESKDYPDDFVVYKLAKNKITRVADAYLSPLYKEVDEGYWGESFDN